MNAATPAVERAMVIFFATNGIPDDVLRHMLDSVRVQVASRHSVTYYALAATLPRLSGMIETVTEFTEEISSKLLDADRVYLVGNFTGTIGLKGTSRLFCVELHGQILQKKGPPEPHPRDRHVFGRLAGQNSLYFSPYGFFSGGREIGPCDAFGFRVPENWRELAKREKNHKLVVCFGGSTTYSPYCLPHQMFPQVIEDRLNRHAAETGEDVRFSVLNFGIPSAVTLNAIMAYVLFAQELRPDVVISHDGANDLGQGLMTDPWLLEEHRMTYFLGLEDWAQLLHKTPDQPLSQDGVPYKVVNPPVASLRAYIARKRQFHDLVVNAGGLFVWGLQPILDSKSAMHPYEKGLIKNGMSVFIGIYEEVYRNIALIYNMYINKFSPPAGCVYVDFHSIFKEKNENDFLFWDTVHLTHHGDAFVGRTYADNLIRHFWGGNPS